MRSRVVGWLIAGVWFLCRALLIAWATLAIYYSNLPWAGLRLALAARLCGVCDLGRLAVASTGACPLSSSALFLGVVAWWISISSVARSRLAAGGRGDAARDHRRRPCAHHRRAQLRLPEPERLSRCAMRSVSVQLSHLTGLDFYVSYWSEGPVGHTFLSFIFDNAPPLSISIETRPEVGEGFDPIASLFKQFELIYVVGDERDLVGVRANHRRETVYLYRLNTSADDARRLLMVYLAADQRTRRSAGILSPAEQQLHDQHHPLRQRRRPRRPVRHPPSPQRSDRQLPLSLGPGRHDAAVRRIAAALPDQRGRAGGRRRARFLATHSCVAAASLIAPGRSREHANSFGKRAALAPVRLSRAPHARPARRMDCSPPPS